MIASHGSADIDGAFSIGQKVEIFVSYMMLHGPIPPDGGSPARVTSWLFINFQYVLCLCFEK